jgi:hypothetical protein
MGFPGKGSLEREGASGVTVGSPDKIESLYSLLYNKQ